MSYSSIVKPHGVVPKEQGRALLTLQASSDGEQEIAYSSADEMLVEFFTDCYVCQAASEEAATALFDAGSCCKRQSGDIESFWPDADRDNSVWVRNSADLEASEAINVIRYTY